MWTVSARPPAASGVSVRHPAATRVKGFLRIIELVVAQLIPVESEADAIGGAQRDMTGTEPEVRLHRGSDLEDASPQLLDGADLVAVAGEDGPADRGSVIVDVP